MHEGPKQWIGGEVLERESWPSSFIIKTNKGQVRERNSISMADVLPNAAVISTFEEITSKY